MGFLCFLKGIVFATAKTHALCYKLNMPFKKAGSSRNQVVYTMFRQFMS